MNVRFDGRLAPRAGEQVSRATRPGWGDTPREPVARQCARRYYTPVLSAAAVVIGGGETCEVGGERPVAGDVSE